MKIKSVQGNVLFEGAGACLRENIEQAHRARVRMPRVNLRSARLAGVYLDDAVLTEACLWGADLTNADLAGVDLTGADLRGAVLKDTCIAGASLRNADLRGAYFSKTIIRDTDFSGIRFSCPSFFDLELHEAASLSGAVYWHRGETECLLSAVPLQIRGRLGKLVILDDYIIRGTELIALPGLLQSAHKPMPKTVPKGRAG